MKFMYLFLMIPSKITYKSLIIETYILLQELFLLLSLVTMEVITIYID